MISETKLDNSFPQNQFVLEGFNQPYRLDRDSNGGGILVFIRNDIPSKLITNIDTPIECIFIEINLRKKNGYFVALIIHTIALSNLTWIISQKILMFFLLLMIIYYFLVTLMLVLMTNI